MTNQDAETSWWRGTVALVLGVTAARLAYLAWGCPYTLVEDEAHYWEWSRRLDWSYYSKGPGIAMLIRVATEALGTSEFAVRAPAAIAGAIAAIAIASLGRDVSGSRRVGFYAAAAFLLAPMMQTIAIVTTIDGPYAACWAVACLAAWRALRREGRWAWLVLGAAVGVGFLFKYTILLLPPGMLLFALVQRRNLRLAVGWPVWCAAGLIVAGAGLAPVCVWNAQHDWPTVHHLLGHLGVAGGDVPIAAPTDAAGRGIDWLRHILEPAQFITTQFGMIGPALVIALIAAVRLWRGRKAEAARSEDNRAGQMFLVCCAAPVLVFYLAVAFFNEAEGNWALGAYVTLLPLAGWTAADAMTEYARRVREWLAEPPGPNGRRPKRGILRRKPELPVQMLWHFAICYGLIAGVVMLRLDWAAAGLERAGVRAGGIGRFLGADEMAEHVADLAADLRRETGKEPFVIARHYGRASVLAFYLRDTPLHVYCASSRMEGRRSQYDLWPDTDLDDPALIGRPAVLAGDGEQLWGRAFSSVRPVGTLQGDRKRGRPAFLGIEYRGMPADHTQP